MRQYISFESPQLLWLLTLPLALLILSSLKTAGNIAPVSALENWRFFSLSLPKSTSKRRFRPSALTLLYSLAIATAIIVLAGPRAVTGIRSSTVILDNSISMQRRYKDGSTNFDRAKSHVQRLLSEGGTINLIFQSRGAPASIANLNEKDLASITPTEAAFDIQTAYSSASRSDRVIFITDSFSGEIAGLNVIEVEESTPLNAGIAAFDISGDRVLLRILSNFDTTIEAVGRKYTLKKGANNIVIEGKYGTVTIDAADDLDCDNFVDIENSRLNIKFEGDRKEFYRLLKSIDWIGIDDSKAPDLIIVNKLDSFNYPADTNCFAVMTAPPSFEIDDEKLAESLELKTAQGQSSFSIPVKCAVRPVKRADQALITLCSAGTHNAIAAVKSRGIASIYSGIDIDALLKSSNAAAALVYELLARIRNDVKPPQPLPDENEIMLKPATMMHTGAGQKMESSADISGYFIYADFLLVMLCAFIQFRR